MMRRVLRLTERQWNDIPKGRKGHIGSATRYGSQDRPGYVPNGVQRGVPTTDSEFLGRRTLRMGKRMLVEGIGFVIVDESLV